MTTRNFTAVEAGDAPVALSAAKAHLQVAHNDDDTLIQHLLDTAAAMLDGPTGRLGRCLSTQKWKLSLDGFPTGDLVIGLPPVKSVESVKYLDPDGVERTLDSSAYRLTGVGRDGTLTPTAGWPRTLPGYETVTVSFTAGSTPVPEPLVLMVLLLVGFWYESRFAADKADAMTTALPLGFDDLAWNYKQYRAAVL